MGLRTGKEGTDEVTHPEASAMTESGKGQTWHLLPGEWPRCTALACS